MQAMTTDPTPKSRPGSGSGDTSGDGGGGGGIGSSHALGSPGGGGGPHDGQRGPATPGAGARFVVRVLEAGTMAALVEPLRDGSPRLQQAYLNLLNLIFTTDLKVFISGTGTETGTSAGAAAKGGGSGPHTKPNTKSERARADKTDEERVAVDTAFRSARQFFLGSASLPPTLGTYSSHSIPPTLTLTHTYTHTHTHTDAY